MDSQTLRGKDDILDHVRVTPGDACAATTDNVGQVPDGLAGDVWEKHTVTFTPRDIDYLTDEAAEQLESNLRNRNSGILANKLNVATISFGIAVVKSLLI